MKSDKRGVWSVAERVAPEYSMTEADGETYVHCEDWFDHGGETVAYLYDDNFDDSIKSESTEESEEVDEGASCDGRTTSSDTGFESDSLDEFDLGGLSQEKVRKMNKIAPPGQRIEDIQEYDILDEFDLGGLSRIEAVEFNRAAPPGQRLEDVYEKDQPDGIATPSQKLEADETFKTKMWRDGVPYSKLYWSIMEKLFSENSDKIKGTYAQAPPTTRNRSMQILIAYRRVRL